MKFLSDLSKIMSYIECARRDVAELTLDLVKIDSETGYEKEVVEFYAEYLRKLGLEVKLQPVETDRSNVIAEIKGKGQGASLMLQGHLDTIPRGNCVPPSIDWREGRIYGRGAADNKGSLASAAIVVKTLLDLGIELEGDLFIVGCVGEEQAEPKPDGSVWKNGAKRLIESGFRVDAGVVLECSPPLQVAIANKTNVRFEITILGADRIYHETERPLNLNPLFWQAEVIMELKRMNDELSKKVHPLLGSPTINLGRVVGGDFSNPQHNTVPTSCLITGMRRMLPGESKETVRREFQSMLERVKEKFPFDFKLNLVGEPSAWEISPEERIVKSFLKALSTVTGKSVKPTGYPSQGDARWFNRGATAWHRKYNPEGITTICFGPGGAPHSDKEHVEIENLVTLAKVCALAAIEYCGSPVKAP